MAGVWREDGTPAMTHAWLVARLDWRRLWRSSGVAIVTGVLVGLLVVAAWAGKERVEAAERSAAAVRARESALRQALAEAVGNTTTTRETLTWTLSNPDYLANDRGTLAVRAAPPLAALSVGKTNVFPSEVKVTAAGTATGTALADLAHPLTLTLGAFDVEFVIVFLWPLAIIAIFAEVVAGERERGTLPLLLAQPVPAAALVVGWGLARGSLLLLPVVIVPVLTVLFDPAPLSAVAMVTWTAVVAGYGLFWVGLSLWVSARTQAAAITTIWMGSAWLALALIIPGTVHLVASTWGEVPSEVVFADATRAATRDALSDGSRVLGHFLEDHPTAAAIGRDGLRQYALLQAARDQEVARRLAPVVQRFEVAVDRRRRVVAALRALSPAMVVSDGLEQAAGTSGDRGRDFLAQVDAFRSEWQAFFTPRILADTPLTAVDAAAVPQFIDRPEAWSHVARRTWPGLAWVSGLGIAFAGAAARRMSRFPLGSARP